MNEEQIMVGEREEGGIWSRSCLTPLKLMLRSGVGYLIDRDRFG